MGDLCASGGGMRGFETCVFGACAKRHEVVLSGSVFVD